MYKNQLQELAQRSCFNLPAYSCIREGPDHAPRFKAAVNFNGETFEGLTFCSTLRQAEHAAAELALNTLASKGPSRALAARVLDETGVYKNLLQETAHRAGLKLPVYTTVRTGPGHVPTFKCMVELAGMSFTGEPARTKKQAQKNAAMAAWSALKRLVQHGSSLSTSIVSQHGSCSSAASSLETRRGNEEQEQVTIARFLASTQTSELKNKEVESQQIQGRFIPVCRELTSPTLNFYPMHCLSWAYPSFSSEMALCQMWQQEQLLQLQHRLLTVQVPQAPVPGPQCLPYMHTMLSPDSHLFVPTREPEPSPAGPRITITGTRPSLCFSDHLVSDPIRGKSTVTIQEIQEEKPEESSDCLSSICPDSMLLGNINAEPRLKELVLKGDKQKNGEQESKAQNVWRAENQIGRFEHPLSGSMDPGCKAVGYRVQNPGGFDAFPSYGQCPSRPSPSKSFRPPSVAHPVMIRSVRPIPSSASSPLTVRNVGPVSSLPRPQDSTSNIHVPARIGTGIPSHSARSYPQRMDVGGVHPRLLAPAVRIRSVIPVCAAPPRKTSSPSKGGVLPPRDKVETIPEDIAATGSESDRLKI